MILFLWPSLAASLIVSIGGATALTSSPPAIVNIAAGSVRGAYCPSARTLWFQGIPYAQPPVGKLRFMPPQPFIDSFKGRILTATSPAAPCIQFTSNPVDPTPSEDCLYLDVYAPASVAPRSLLPVKVWSYGGGNLEGAITNPMYNGCNLAEDAIVVAFNYRVGPLGFLGLAKAGIQGNMAIQDHLEALRWVKSNIAAFGGDPKKIMLFGESAGADNTFVVSTLPIVKTLISAAVMESGGGVDMIPFGIAQYSGSSFAKTLGCKSTDIKCLQSRSVDQLIDAFGRTPALQENSQLTLSFGVNLPNMTSLSSPILDGKIIPKEPLKTGSKVPVIVGTNVMENTLFDIPYYENSPGPITEDNYTQFLNLWGPVAPLVAKKYPLARFNQSGTVKDAIIRAVTHVTTTISYTCQSYKTLRAAIAAGSPTYAYRFNHTPTCPWLWYGGQPAPNPDLLELYGSTHTADLPFVFSNLDNLPWGNGTCDLTMKERELSKTLVTAWTRMADKGNPSTLSHPWPRFDICETKGVFIDRGVKVEKLDISECQFWDDVWASLGGVRIPPPRC